MAAEPKAVSEPKMIRVWITKWALTMGILTAEAEVCLDVRGSAGRMIVVRGNFAHYFHKPDWHVTESEARARCEIMRTRKINSLAKQQVKTQDLEFTINPLQPTRRLA